MMSLAVLVAPSIALAGTTIAAPSRSQATQVVPTVLEDELQALEEREAANPELAEFEGGSPVIIIGSGTLLIILVVVLVVLVLR